MKFNEYPIINNVSDYTTLEYWLKLRWLKDYPITDEEYNFSLQCHNHLNPKLPKRYTERKPIILFLITGSIGKEQICDFYIETYKDIKKICAELADIDITLIPKCKKKC